MDLTKIAVGRGLAGLAALLPEGKPPETNAFAIRRDRSAFRERVLALNVHSANQFGLAPGVETLNAQQHNRRPTTARDCEMCVEIVVERHTDTTVVPSPFQDLDIVGSLHPDLRDMNRIETVVAQNRRRLRASP